MALTVIVIPVLIAFILYFTGAGDIVRTKIRLKNIADSAAISAATWQARGLNILVAMNNGIEACYITIAIMLPALLFALCAGNGQVSTLLFKAIEKAWKTAIDIAFIQEKFAKVPWSTIAFGEAMFIINKNGVSGIAVPIPAFKGINKPDHAIGLYSHKATLKELLEPPEEKENTVKNKKSGKIIDIPAGLDCSVKKVIWNQKWKQTANSTELEGAYNLPWKNAMKVGKFYGPSNADSTDKSSFPNYPAEYRKCIFYPGEHEDEEIIGWKMESRPVVYDWPETDPPKNDWYIKRPEIRTDTHIVWPKEWEHLEEGYRWGYSVHDSYWCYKWEPLFKDDSYSVIDELRELMSKFSSFNPDNIPLPYIRDKEITHDEACIVLTFKSFKDSSRWKLINNFFNIKPPVVYAVSQARIFRRNTRKSGITGIKKVSNETCDMTISFPSYEAGIEKLNPGYLINNEVIKEFITTTLN